MNNTNSVNEFFELTCKQLDIELLSLEDLLKKVENLDDVFFKIDMVEKKDRYGNVSYNYKYLNNKFKNICSHMKSYVYLKNLKSIIEEDIDAIKKEKIRIKRKMGN